MDFIFLDGKRLQIFDKFKKVLLSYDFNNSIQLKPQLFSINNQAILGIVDRTENQLYLFNKDGILKDKIRKGNTPFVTGRLNKSASPSLLIGSGKSLFNYPLD